MFQSDNGEQSVVVIISGGTGVGTTSLAVAVAPVVQASSIIGTDSIREALRGVARSRTERFLDHERAVLAASSYDTWRLLRSSAPSEDEMPSREEVVAGFYAQADFVMEATLSAARRALTENYTVIVERVHLPLDRVQKREIWGASAEEWDQIRRRVFRVLLTCDDATQEEHIRGRDPKYTGRDTDRQLLPINLAAIRIIRRELAEVGDGRAHLRLDSKMGRKAMVNAFGARYFGWQESRGTDKRQISLPVDS